MYDDDYAPMATMADAHAEWHRNTGVPMGQPGCPQDACDPDPDPEPELYEALAAYEASVPALRPGEEPAHYVAMWPHGPEVKWWTGADDEPPF